MARAYRLIKGVEHLKAPLAWNAYLDLAEVWTSPTKPERQVRRGRLWGCEHEHVKLTDADTCASEAQRTGVWIR